MSGNQANKYQNNKVQNEAKIEQDFLKGTRDPDLGVYCDLFSAKSGFEGQDGGVVTALLVGGFNAGLFDAAIVVRRGEGYSAEAFVASNTHEVNLAKGTMYLRVNVAQKLKELIDQGKKRIAVVATPCQVKNIRKIQQTLKTEANITIIGLFCFEAFNKTKLKQETLGRLGIDLDKAEKTRVQQGKFSALVGGKEYSCRIKDLNCAVESACLYCDDFTSRFADISVGSMGSKKGYSTVIARSKVGMELLSTLTLNKETVDIEEIKKLSISKKVRAKRSFELLNKPK